MVLLLSIPQQKYRHGNAWVSNRHYYSDIKLSYLVSVNVHQKLYNRMACQLSDLVPLDFLSMRKINFQNDMYKMSTLIPGHPVVLGWRHNTSVFICFFISGIGRNCGPLRRQELHRIRNSPRPPLFVISVSRRY